MLIHYGSLHHPPEYVETSHPLERLQEKCKEFSIPTRVTEPGQWHGFPVFPGFSDYEEAARLGVRVSMTQVRSNGHSSLN